MIPSPLLHFENCPSFEDIILSPYFRLLKLSSSFMYAGLGGESATTFLQENGKIVNHPRLSPQSHINVYSFSQRVAYPIEMPQKVISPHIEGVWVGWVRGREEGGQEFASACSLRCLLFS